MLSVMSLDTSINATYVHMDNTIGIKNTFPYSADHNESGRFFLSTHSKLP